MSLWRRFEGPGAASLPPVLRRRLLVLLAFLLLCGAVAAVVSPREARKGETTTTQRQRPQAPRVRPQPAPPRTAIVRASVGEPPLVRARVGELLQLSISVDAPVSLSIVDQGRIESGDPDTPVRFEFIAERAGRFAVTRVADGVTVARLQVSPAS